MSANFKLRPLHDKIVVKRVETEEKTAGGIILVDSAQEKPSQGEVLATGNGSIAEDGSVRALDVKVGDTVVFGKWSGTEMNVDGEEVLIMKESDIMGIMVA